MLYDVHFLAAMWGSAWQANVFCPGHSPCYLAGHYNPFHAPCLPCINWLRGFVNPLLSPSKRLECVHALRDWFRRILRRNADRKLNVTSVEDPVLLGILKGKKFIIPPASDMEARLRAINYSLDNEFPELESPKSVASTPSSTLMHKFAKSFAEAVHSPDRQDQYPTQQPSAEPEGALALSKALCDPREEKKRPRRKTWKTYA